METNVISRRRFVAACSATGITSTLLPGVLWARVQDQSAARITGAILADALRISGLEFTEDERQQMLNGLNQNLARYEDLRKIAIDDAVAPPMYYSPLVPGVRSSPVAARSMARRVPIFASVEV